MTLADAELPPDPALALPIVTNIPSSRGDDGRPDSPLVTVLLQVSHRVGTVALFAVLAAAGMAFTSHEFFGPLAAAAGCADVGLCAALLVLFRSPRNGLAAVSVGAGLIALIVLIPADHGWIGMASAVAGALLGGACFIIRPEPVTRGQWRESIGAGAFNGCLFAAALLFILVARFGVLAGSVRDLGYSVRAQAQDFFTAPPTLPPPPP